jgi:hypothetical protein
MKKGIFFLALLLVALGVIGFQTGAYHEFQKLFVRDNSSANVSGNHGGSGSNNNNSTSPSNYIEVNTIFNYGNRTSTWFNKTRVSESRNFYNLTVFLTDGRVHSQAFPDLQNEHQVLGINGLEQNSTDYWSLWKYCPSYSAWAWSPVGADRISLSNNGIYGWYYQNQNTHYAPVAGAATVTILDISSC